MKIEIERYIIMIGNNTENLSVFNQFNRIVLNAKLGEEFITETMADSENYPNFWFYRGGSHIAVHQVIDGKPSNQRLLLITF